MILDNKISRLFHGFNNHFQQNSLTLFQNFICHHRSSINLQEYPRVILKFFFSVIRVYHILQQLKRKHIVCSNKTTNKLHLIAFFTLCIKSFESYKKTCHRYLLQLSCSCSTNIRTEKVFIFGCARG